MSEVYAGWPLNRWLYWGAQVRLFFSTRGAVVKKFIIAEPLHQSFYFGVINCKNGDMKVDTAEVRDRKTGKGRTVALQMLYGIPVLFTPKLSGETCLFLLEPDNGA